MWNKGNPHSLLVGVQNGAATWEDSLALYQTLNTLLRCYPSILLVGILPKQVENLGPPKNLYTDVYSSFIYNC